MHFLNQFREDLHELARLVSSITGAHSTAIFLPSDILPGETRGDAGSHRGSSIDLVAVHSQSKLVKNCRVQVGHGLLGWVAQHGRSIHLAPCEVGGSALSLYVEDEPIRSLVAVPVAVQGTINTSNYLRTTSPAQSNLLSSGPCGVLMCDSLRADGFTSAQIKILEQFAAMIPKLLSWVHKAGQGAQVETSWEVFRAKTLQLGEAIGHSSVEILRIRLESLQELESHGGVTLAVQLSEQFVRLAQQAIPPHFPCVRLPDGDVALALDDMMSGFFQHKLQALASHLSSAGKPLEISIECYRAKLSGNGHCNIDLTLQQQPVSIKSSANLGGVRA